MEDRIPPLVLREVNDRIYGVLRDLGSEDGEFHCECGDERCSERLELLVIEYAARDARPFLAPGHTPAAAVAAG